MTAPTELQRFAERLAILLKAQAALYRCSNQLELRVAFEQLEWFVKAAAEEAAKEET